MSKKPKYTPGEIYRVIKKYKNGDKYEGEMLDGKKSGNGVYSFSDGRKYVGEWGMGKRHGMGCLYYNSGEIQYEGEFKNNKKDGFGVQYLENGGKYEGEWMSNKPHGQGKEFLPDGTINLEGEFFEGVYVPPPKQKKSKKKKPPKEVEEEVDASSQKSEKTKKRRKKKKKKKKGGFMGMFKKKEKKEKVVISYPKLFRRHGHIGFVEGKGFTMENIPDDWMKFFLKDCGNFLDENALEDAETAKVIMKAVARFNEKEAVKKIEEETGLNEEEQKELEEKVETGELDIGDIPEVPDISGLDDFKPSPAPPSAPSPDGLDMKESAPKKKKTAHIPKNDMMHGSRGTLFDQIKNREAYLKLRKVKTRMGPPDLTNLSKGQKNDLISIMKGEIEKMKGRVQAREETDSDGENGWDDDSSDDGSDDDWD